MSESLKRVLTKIKATAREMRREKHAQRLAPKPKDPPKTEKPTPPAQG